jgi:hypothetical protein
MYLLVKIEHAAYDYQPFPTVCGIYTDESIAKTELDTQSSQYMKEISDWRLSGWEEGSTDDPIHDYRIIQVDKNSIFDLRKELESKRSK